MEASTFENPLRRGLRLERTPEPCTVVIFGSSGDLTKRKLIPALYNLALERLLPSGFSVIGFARTEMSHEAFRQKMREAVDTFSRTRPVQAAAWESFAQGLYYLPADFRAPESYSKLRDLLAALDRDRGACCNRVFYLAVPPSAYMEIIRRLGSAGLAQSGAHGWTRIIIEKPFGRDLETARELNREVSQVFREDQVYRIDHYVGKETVQNIFVFRFANGIFEPIWNRGYIDHVQITAAENLGVEGRGAYYEEAGVIRDMIQNHMLQLLCLVAMEAPSAFDADAVRDEKVKVLRTIRPIAPDDVDRYAVRGQYGKGWLAGEPALGYRLEKGVKPDSTTETYAVVKLLIDNWRWADVPFYLRSGKALPKRVTEIAIQFKPAPHRLFRQAASDPLEPNVLALRIQPDEGISLTFGTKLPSPILRIRPVNMDFRYWTSFGSEPPEAYERLLLDGLLGDSTLFARRDWVETAWALITPILEAWKRTSAPEFPNYEAGTWSPKQADEFIEKDGRRWRRL
ncbi:MAG: glucose-6-phosphate dehydrogenase [Acidobacteria bacterium]|nr:glucose-6-phosphate dehydrogenase [Acidobacteriota bacterium]MBI3658519.1 glucose-6-phosphate dehydrogenase [Acidobacteriota bacterium]